MITITIDKKKYKGVYRWDDITLRGFAELAAIPIPESYEAFILADNLQSRVEQANKMGDKELNETFPDYYKKVILCLTNIPKDVLDKQAEEWIADCYGLTFRPFVYSLIYHKPLVSIFGELRNYTPEKIKRFRIGFSYYYLPESLMLNGTEIPLANEPIVTYTDAADVLSGIKMNKDDIKRLAQFTATYCRKKGEEPDDQKVVSRMEKFMDLPMSTVWAVFFYTLMRLNESRVIIQLFGSLHHPMREVVGIAQDLKDLGTEG